MRPTSISFKLAVIAAAAVGAMSPPLAAAAQPARDDDDRPVAQRPEKAGPPQSGAPRTGRDADEDDEAQPVTEIVVTARRLDAARASVEPSLGASTYTLSNAAVEGRPGGESANLVHVMLQMPGVSQSGSGAIRVRGQANLQYRINNVIVPQGFADLADTLRARFADRVELVTGALPAQYGLQVGGIVNVTTKNGVYEHGGEVELYGGSHGHGETAFEAAGNSGQTNFYVSGSYLRDDVGLSAPDGSSHPLHDRTEQIDGFAFVDHIIDASSRISLIAGFTHEQFQLPTVRGMDTASFAAPAPFQRPLRVGAVASFPSERLAGKERNNAQYDILSYQRTGARLTFQVSGFVAYSTLTLESDPIGDLLFTGLSQAVRNTDLSAGLQAEGVYDLATTHKLRAGLVTTWRRETNKAQFLALPIDAQGRQLSTAPLALFGRTVGHRGDTSFFAEDEWRPVDGLTVNLGLRFDDVAGDGGGQQVSPRANATWVAPTGTSLHAGYARYFVPAPSDEVAGWPAVLVRTTGAAPSGEVGRLRAETDDYFDVGVEQKAGGLTLGVDAYWREAANLLDEVRVGRGSFQRPFNFGRGRMSGVEFNAIYDNGPFSAWGNLAVSRVEGRGIVSNQAMFTPLEIAATFTRYNPVNQDQRYTGSVGAAYKWRALRISADAIYGSGLPRTAADGAVNQARLPSYVQVNVSAVYRIDGFRDRPLDLRVDVINAFDRRYEISDGTSLGGGVPQWGPREGLLVGLEQQF